MGISIGMVGLGSFASCFVDLFKSHPLVDRIAFCDREPPEAGTLLNPAHERANLRISKVLRPGGAGFGAEPQ